jgi:vacuolar-type H+-ATPase subunit I/STV1
MNPFSSAGKRKASITGTLTEKDTDSPEGDLPDDNNDDDNEKPDEATEPEKEDQDIEIEIEDNEKTSEEIEETLERDEDLPEKEREEENEEEKEEKSVLNEEATIEGATYVLKRFYESINNGAYEEAYDLLDERVKFNAFKKLFSQIFGDIEIEIEIDKEDIDVEYFALFIESTGMFKNDEIGKIISEEINNNNSIISYYHTMIMTTSSGIEQEINMPMIATLNKTEKGWRILAFDDGDMNNEPFNTSPF